MKIDIDWKVILIIITCFFFIYQERVLDVYMYAMGIHSPVKGTRSQSPQGSYTPPKMLFRQNGLLYLHSVNEAIIPGVNPLIFHTYQDYLNYCNFRQSQGIYTPVLQLQNATMPTHQMIAPATVPDVAPPPPPPPPSPPEGNLAPSTSDVTEGFCEYRKKSINPMDTNWGGCDYTDSYVGPAGPYNM